MLILERKQRRLESYGQQNKSTNDKLCMEVNASKQKFTNLIQTFQAVDPKELDQNTRNTCLKTPKVVISGLIIPSFRIIMHPSRHPTLFPNRMLNPNRVPETIDSSPLAMQKQDKTKSYLP